MTAVIFVFICIASLPGLFLFGFFFGRCARRLPLMDESLPWTLNWGEIIPACNHDGDSSGQLPGRPWSGSSTNNDGPGWHAPHCGRSDCPAREAGRFTQAGGPAPVR